MSERDIKDDARKLLGLPPYQGPDNPQRGDTDFAVACAEHWGERNFATAQSQVLDEARGVSS